MKQSALQLIRNTGVFEAFRVLNRAKALVLTYHRFTVEEAEDGTSADLLEGQIQYLRSRYHLVPLSELAYCLRAGVSIPPRSAAMTIDDGYADSYRVAFPILRKYRVPATLFVVTDFLDRQAWLWTDKTRYLSLRTKAPILETVIGDCRLKIELNGRQSRLEAATRVNSLLKQLPDDHKEETIRHLSLSLDVTLPQLPPEEFAPLSWEEARQMDAAGVEVASHTVTHPILTNVDERRLRIELGSARERLESELGHRVDLFCYPNGALDDRVRSEVYRAGYRCAVTTRPGLVDGTSDPLSLERIHTERDLTHFIQSTCGFEQIKNRVRRLGSAVAARPDVRLTRRNNYAVGNNPKLK